MSMWLFLDMHISCLCMKTYVLCFVKELAWCLQISASGLTPHSLIGGYQSFRGTCYHHPYSRTQHTGLVYWLFIKFTKEYNTCFLYLINRMWDNITLETNRFFLKMWRSSNVLVWHKQIKMDLQGNEQQLKFRECVLLLSSETFVFLTAV